MVGIFDYTINIDVFDAGELLGEASRKFSSHIAQQTRVIDIANDTQSARFGKVVVLHVDVLVGDLP